MSTVESFEKYSLLNVGLLPDDTVGTLADEPSTEDERMIRSSGCIEGCCPTLRARIEIGADYVRWFSLHNPFSSSMTIEDKEDLLTGWRSEYLFSKRQYLQAVVTVLKELRYYEERSLALPGKESLREEWANRPTMLQTWLDFAETELQRA